MRIERPLGCQPKRPEVPIATAHQRPTCITELDLTRLFTNLARSAELKPVKTRRPKWEFRRLQTTRFVSDIRCLALLRGPQRSDGNRPALEFRLRYCYKNDASSSISIPAGSERPVLATGQNHNVIGKRNGLQRFQDWSLRANSGSSPLAAD